MDRYRCDSTTENPCPVCHDTIEVYAIGPCDHPVCYKCSTRMRVLCEQMDCPICRSAMPQVAFVYEKKLFTDLNLRDCIPNRRNKIFYECEDIEDDFLDLLEFRCRQCPKRKPDRTFAQLQTHMRKEHHLFVCDICLIHLKIFPYETKFYDRKSLAVHRRLGDEDDKSYKGHPLCEFCDTRYLDKDELMKHLRKDHFFCHFCDQEGSNAYYNDYPDLLVHFGDSHYLCTEDECGSSTTRFTHAFSSDIDLKSHKATVHNKKSRETRTIEVDFQFAPRHAGYTRGSGISSDDYEDSGTHRQRNRGDRFRRRPKEDSNLQRALEASLEDKVEAKARPPVEERVPDPIQDFPTLAGGVSASSSSNATANAVTTSNAANSQRPTKPVDHFPTLSSVNGNDRRPQNPTGTSNKNYAAITHFSSQPRPVVKEQVKVSQPVSLGTVKAKNKDRWAMSTPNVTEDDYPVLVGKSKPITRGSSASASAPTSTWLQKPIVSEEPTPTSVAPSFSVIKSKPTETVPQPRMPTSIKSISDEEEFPSLGGGAARQEISWLKPKFGGNSKPSQKPRTEKVDDEWFDLPESYYKSYEQSVPNKVKDKIKEEKSDSNSKKGVSLHKKDFPDLPQREMPGKQVKSDLNDKSKDGGKKSKKPKNGPKHSLDNIAAGLVGETTIKPTLKVKEKKNKNKTNQNGNSSNANSSKDVPKPKVTDWFDNPPAVKENPKPPAESKSKKEPVPNNNNNNFPSLHAMSSPVQKAKTISAPVENMNPPPGFTSNPAPVPNKNISAPPGFSKPAPPGLSKPMFSVHAYIQPADFTSRNQALVKNIRSSLDTVANGFESFKTLSFQFRQGEINANLYYSNCQFLMGDTDFRQIFPELLALLPDINKQQELWFEYQVVSSGCSSSKQGSNIKSMQSCPQCSQVILKEDLQHHKMQHGDVQDFPSLGVTTDYSANRSIKGAWIKAT